MKPATLAAVAVIATLSGASQSMAGNCTPSRIAGTWEVVEVELAPLDNMHQLYHEGDPRLIGRSLTIEAGKVRFSYGKDTDCRQAKFPPYKTTWGKLFWRAFDRTPTSTDSSRQASAEDFGFPVRKEQPVTVYPLCSSTGSPAKGAWVLPYEKDELLLREDSQYLLRLTRRPADAKPSPATIDCSKPASPTQVTICNDHDLASWDRSVGRALDNYIKFEPEKAEQARQAQAEYLLRRDACGTDVDCIEREARQRVDDLIQ